MLKPRIDCKMQQKINNTNFILKNSFIHLCVTIKHFKSKIHTVSNSNANTAGNAFDRTIYSKMDEHPQSYPVHFEVHYQFVNRN